MKFIIYFLFITIMLTACEKVDENIRDTICLDHTSSEYPVVRPEREPCTSEICNRYLLIWEEIMQEKNNLSDTFFEDYVHLYSMNVNEWVQGSSFNICYEVKIDWAIALQCDQFIIKINAENTYYPATSLPRDIELNKEEVALAVENRAFNSNIGLLSNEITLKHGTLESAISDLIASSEVNLLCFTMLKVNRENGNLTLEALAQYENEENSCVRGSIDLITGAKEVFDSPCYI